MPDTQPTPPLVQATPQAKTDTPSAAPGAPNHDDPPRLVRREKNPVPDEFLDSAVLHYVTTRDGARLRTAYWAFEPGANHRQPRGTVLVMSGYSEFIEKYYEVAFDLQRLGFAVLCFDWRGQGLSSRAHEQRRGWVPNYEAMMADTLELADYLQELHAPAPLIGLGHSMGGNVCIRLLESGQAPFEIAVVTAPMLGIKGMPNWLMRGLTRAGSQLGMDTRYAPGAKDNDPFGPHVPLCSDAQRIEYWRGYLREDPWLITHGVTWRWAREAASSMHVVNQPDNAARITIPLLVVSPLADSLVDPKPTRKFCALCDAAELLELENCEHEVLQESDALRNTFFTAFDAFVKRHQKSRYAPQDPE